MDRLNNFITKSKKTHKGKYSYDKVLYINAKVKVIITCPVHGDFMQTPDSHSRSGCYKCGREKLLENRSKNRLAKKFQGLQQPKEYKLIPLGNGVCCKVDNEDFDKVKDMNWTLGGFGYASNSYTTIHRYIMNPPKGKVVDHINGDKLDNRRCNMRVCTQANNTQNSRSFIGKSKYKGVCKEGESGKWFAYIGSRDNREYLGYFPSEELAAKAYDKRAKERYGEYANLNFKNEN